MQVPQEPGKPVEFQILPWLDNWYKPIWKGRWHAPIVMVDGEIIAQGDALNRGILAEKAVRLYADRFPHAGTHFFGKENCGHCARAKDYLKGPFRMSFKQGTAVRFPSIVNSRIP